MICDARNGPCCCGAWHKKDYCKHFQLAGPEHEPMDGWFICVHPDVSIGDFHFYNPENTEHCPHGFVCKHKEPVEGE